MATVRPRPQLGDPDPRPQLGPALDKLLDSLSREIGALAHIDASTLLVVHGQARGPARASIRSLVEGVATARVVVRGQRRQFELTLRPPWFRHGGVEDRLRTLVHELWHIGARGTGALDPAHRHHDASHRAQAQQVARLCRQALRQLDPLLLAPLGHDGELLLPCWLERPVLTGEAVRRSRYGDRDLFLQPVRMITTRSARTVWW
ncbi:MAG: hypothetical protein ABIJ09_09090 [Pseudomonadota bacterium]